MDTNQKTKQWYRLITDKMVFAACDLRGVKHDDGNSIIYKVIPECFGGKLLRYYKMKSPLGTEFGRWEVSI
jgi:hypothetical protein